MDDYINDLQREIERGCPCLDKKWRQALTGINTSLGALWRRRRRAWMQDTERHNWKVHWCRQVSTRGGEREGWGGLANKQDRTIICVVNKMKNRPRSKKEKEKLKERKDLKDWCDLLTQT